MKRRKSPIKALLLNQSFVAGLGNLYVDESLYQAHIHPLEHADHLNEKQKSTLHQKIQEILRLSIKNHTHFPLLPQSYLLFDRKGRINCPRCKQELKTIQAGGRTSVFCPQCQRLSKSQDKYQ